MRYFKLQSFIYVTVHVKLKGHQKLLSASALVWPSIFFFYITMSYISIMLCCCSRCWVRHVGLRCFFGNKACQPSLVVTQMKLTNLKLGMSSLSNPCKCDFI